MPLKSPRFSGNARLQRAADNNPAMKLGEVGEAVALVQQALIDSGFPMPVSTHALKKPDGIYGSETVGVVKRYQAKNGLFPDGEVGRDTLTALDAAFPAPPTPTPPSPPAPPPIVFHPGVNHGHSPSGRWSDIQANPNSSTSINLICSHASPRQVVDAAVFAEFRDKPIAKTHLDWYLTGGGADLKEDKNIEKMLREDRGVQQAISLLIPPGRTTGKFSGFLKIEQSNYTNQDLRFAFGAIDRLDFEVDFDAGTIHAWFQDRYEWHPYYPGLYTVFPDDGPRETNCVHAALVELKSAGAADYWMKGEATVPLSVFIPGPPPAPDKPTM